VTKEELKTLLDAIEKEYKDKKYQAYKRFADLNDPYKKGDIVTDGDTTIRIEKIYLSSLLNEGIPSRRYSGPRLKKDLTPFKSGEHDSVFQTSAKGIDQK